jgi:hypothetical protein
MLVQWRALPPASEVVAPVWAYVEVRGGAMPITCSEWMVASTLEPGQALSPGRYCRTTAHCWDWWPVVRCHFLIGSFEFKFDRLNTNLIIFDCLRSKNSKTKF